MANTFLNKRRMPLGQGFTPSLQVELFGSWDETVRMLQKTSPATKSAGIKAQTKICNDLLKRVKGHLRNQDLGWAPLSQVYADRKAKAGFDSRTLIAYGTYYHSIKVWTSGNKHLVMVGVPRGIYTVSTRGKKSKMEVARIAAVHEFSSGKRIPKRPLWNPTIREMGGARGLKAAFVKSFVAHLRVQGIPIKEYSKLSL